MKNYLENVDHTTQARPYSFHRTEILAARELLLYVHYHPEIELLYVEKGCMELFVENKSLFLSEGEFVVIPASQIHYAKSVEEQPCTFRAFLFSPNYLLDVRSFPYLQKYMTPFLTKHPEEIAAILKTATDYLEYQGIIKRLFACAPYAPEKCELKLHGILLELWQLLCDDYATDKGAQTGVQTRDFVDKVLEYIQQNYGENITLQDLAYCCNVSKEYFCRTFKAYTGLPPIKYLNRHRIMQSCLLLEQTDEPISTIALSCGFNHISYYNREFASWMGMTPSKYRKRSL